MLMPLDEDKGLQQRVSRAMETVEQLEREFEAAVDARGRAESDVARSSAVKHAAIISGKLRDARQRLSDAKRAVAKAQGDDYIRDEATPSI
jgi:hypothetical protein